jgi:hypothetical protein
LAIGGEQRLVIVRTMQIDEVLAEFFQKPERDG